MWQSQFHKPSPNLPLKWVLMFMRTVLNSVPTAATGWQFQTPKAASKLAWYYDKLDVR
jgi:hypothetical protein